MAAGEASTAGSAAVPARRNRSRWRSVLVIGSRLLILVLVGFVAMVYLLQDWMIFPGSATQGSPQAGVHPRSGAELLELATSRGERVVALYGPALLPDGRPHSDALSRPALVYFYGNAMCLAYAEPEFDRFRRLGLNVLIPDYLGYGLSAGKASEIGCRDTAETAYQALLARGFPPSRIISGGWSLGGAVAIDLASRRQVGGLIALSSFTSGAAMARRLFPFLPVALLLRHRFDSEQKIAKLRCPTLIGHGRLDPVVPFEMGERLAAKA